MSEESKSRWASFVRAHRLAQSLNQGEFAKALGVSQQTVSRWESGGQVPDASIQEHLKTQLGTTALSSLAYWRKRVGASRGHEVLVDRDLTILAASRNFLGMLGLDAEKIKDLKILDALPHLEIGNPGHATLQSVMQFRDIGFFDGLIRSIRVEAEWHLPMGSWFCETDVWPVLTSEQTIVGQFCGMPVPVAEDPNGFKGIRVKHIEMKLNKDSGDE